MKIKVLMATLVITLLMGVQGFASPCDCVSIDPCVACDRGVVVKCDLFSGLKKLVSGVRHNNCDPCDAVVACNPCDDVVACNPCDEVCGTPRIALGSRLRSLFASHACNPCDVVNDCNPCDVVTNCDPCGDINGCVTPKFRPFRNLFKSYKRGCDDGCNPCDVVGDCGPCDIISDCDPCGNLCDTDCGPRGHLFDFPRLSLKRLFGGIRGCNDGCNPCDVVGSPCDSACCR